jgi:hypothetical protein
VTTKAGERVDDIPVKDRMRNNTLTPNKIME